MKVSTRGDYASRALLSLALHGDALGPTSVRDIAERTGLPQPYLEQILLSVKGAGLVRSKRGVGGGYVLAYAPEDITLEKGFFTKHVVKVFCYNEQVVDSLTSSIRQTAQAAGVPVVGVYETMPTPGYDYQSWMVAEVAAIRNAVVHGTSTEHL